MKNKAFRLVFLSLALTCSCFGQAQQPCGSDTERITAETEKLKAETAKLTEETANFGRARLINLLQNTIGFLAIVIPIIVVLRQLQEQRESQLKRATVDASLKGVEIAFNASTSEEVRNRAAVLGILLDDLVPGFGKRLKDVDLSKVGFFSYRARLNTLLVAIAGHPERALLIAETYDILFPEDNDLSKGSIKALLNHLKTVES